MPNPIVFISYSHDSQAHKDWVLAFATRLRDNGVEAILDAWHLRLGEDVVAFMERSIARSDRVLLVCTEPYVERADGRSGGVGYESAVITGELVQRIDTKKFIPIVRQAVNPRQLPHYLGARLYLDVSNDADVERRMDELLRELHSQPRSPEPPVGVSPFTSVAPTTVAPTRSVSVTGAAATGIPATSEPWFGSQWSAGESGLSKAGVTGAMEIRSALHESVTKSQIELLNAVKKAEIRTFGWPIGIVLEHRDEYRPKPMPDGIVAEVAVAEKSLSGSPSYDYWAARNNGDFYLLQSLFEDERAKNAIFFDTRIVRVTESFLFLSAFYSNLGVPADTRVTVAIRHLGLKGRILGSAGGRRHVWARKIVSPVAASQISDTIGGLRERAVDHVMQILEPMFMLFEFATFERPIYESIVTKFAAGHIE